MHILKRNEYNSDFYSQTRWSEIIYSYNLNYLEDIKNDLIAIKKLFYSNFKDLSNEEFVKLVSNFYSIYIEKDDILNILSKINGIKYDKIQKLNSTMTFKDIVSEGHGRDFSWWEETFQVIYIVATSNDLTLKANYNYSKEEIKQMIKKKQIISFGKITKERGINPKLPYKTEKFDKIKMLNVSLNLKSVDELLEGFNDSFDFSVLTKDDSILSKEIYNNAVSLIKKRLNKKKVLKDCKEILLFLNENIDSINDVIKNNYFDDKNDKNKYLNLSKEVKQHQKSLLLNFNS